jgi:hypothetical protein
MATKPKTRTAPAAKPILPTATNQDGIIKLIAEWNWLEADRKYRVAITTNPDAKYVLDQLHSAEKAEIKSKLANLVPKNFREVFELFDFAAEAIVKKVRDREDAKTEIKMLTALRRGIEFAQVDEWAHLTVRNVTEIAEAKGGRIPGDPHMIEALRIHASA